MKAGEWLLGVVVRTITWPICWYIERSYGQMSDETHLPMEDE